MIRYILSTNKQGATGWKIKKKEKNKVLIAKEE
jgi:hypothetical protein